MRGFVFDIYMIGSFSPLREDAWEEVIRIYYNESQEAALLRAKSDAILNEVSYETNDGFILTWKVYSVRIVNELDVPLLEGEDIFFRSLTSFEAHSLLGKIE